MGLSVAGINSLGSVRGVSAGYSKVEQTTEQPYNYAVENQSEVSDVFNASLKRIGSNSVTAASPVQYATAQIQTNRINQIEKNQEANRAFNDIAGAYSDVVSSYNQSRQAESYGMVGSTVDLFA